MTLEWKPRCETPKKTYLTGHVMHSKTNINSFSFKHNFRRFPEKSTHLLHSNRAVFVLSAIGYMLWLLCGYSLQFGCLCRFCTRSVVRLVVFFFCVSFPFCLFIRIIILGLPFCVFPWRVGWLVDLPVISPIFVIFLLNDDMY